MICPCYAKITGNLLYRPGTNEHKGNDEHSQ